MRIGPLVEPPFSAKPVEQLFLKARIDGIHAHRTVPLRGKRPKAFQRSPERLPGRFRRLRRRVAANRRKIGQKRRQVALYLVIDPGGCALAQSGAGLIRVVAAGNAVAALSARIFRIEKALHLIEHGGLVVLRVFKERRRAFGGGRR